MIVFSSRFGKFDRNLFKKTGSIIRHIFVVITGKVGKFWLQMRVVIKIRRQSQ